MNDAPDPPKRSNRKAIVIGLSIGVLLILGPILASKLPGVVRELRWQDLKKTVAGNGPIDERKRQAVQEILIHLVPQRGAFTSFIQPSHFWRIATPTGVRVVIAAKYLERDPASYGEKFVAQKSGTSVTGGRRYVRLCLFEDGGRFLGVSDIPLGGQGRIRKMVMVTDLLDDTPVLEIRTKTAVYGPSFRQYLTPIDDRWALLRLEAVYDAKKERRLQRNQFVPDHLSFAPDTLFEDEKSCARALRSDDDRRVLTALTWINGIHERRDFRKRDAHADWVRELLKAEDTRARCVELSQSPIPWVQEAAQQTLALGGR